MILDTIKVLLKMNDNDNDHDEDRLLALMIEDATQAILSYCHLERLPKALDHIVRELVIQKYRDEETKNNQNNIAGIKRGDTQITYASPIQLGDFTEKQQKILNSYRRLKMR